MTGAAPSVALTRLLSASTSSAPHRRRDHQQRRALGRKTGILIQAVPTLGGMIANGGTTRQAISASTFSPPPSAAGSPTAARSRRMAFFPLALMLTTPPSAAESPTAARSRRVSMASTLERLHDRWRGHQQRCDHGGCLRLRVFTSTLGGGITNSGAIHCGRNGITVWRLHNRWRDHQ